MNNPSTDIIVPVWNRPVETRNCLVNLINHTPDARFILVDNGCDRETERMLEEFAEILDTRAILLHNDVNQGYVRAVNRGLSRSDARFAAVISNTSTVTASWLEPLTGFAAGRSDAGIIVPRLVKGSAGKQRMKISPSSINTEADHASLAAMVITREAYDLIGGLDEGMDGGYWCLRDLSRRAYRAGFSTFRVDGGVVFFEEDVPLGSLERRNTALERSISQYRERWGEPRAFCIHMAKNADMAILWQRMEVLLKGARQGHFFSVITHANLYRELMKAGMEHLHDHIRFHKIPLLFEERAMEKALSSENPNMCEAEAVAGIDGVPFSAGIRGMPFAEFERMISRTGEEIYGG